MSDSRAHVVHVVHRFATGGMENGIVNLVNRLPEDRFRHTILALAGVGNIARRITKRDVAVESLDLPPGPLLASLPRLWRRFRALRPSIVHTRNVGTLEAQLAAALAGVAVRVHGEHGWEVHDLVGSNRSLLRTRRMLRRLVHAQIALSTPTYEYLRDRVGVPADRLHSICNGVDTDRFHPRAYAEADTSAPLVVGYVGRLADVKNPILLIDAFERAHALLSGHSRQVAARIRLEVVGDGPLAVAVSKRTSSSALRDAITLVGDRDDVPEQMRRFDVYALPSLAEGISNTLLEAMATGLPCVATRVGGNDELIDPNRTGLLVDSGNVDDFAHALAAYLRDDSLRSAHGGNARERAVERFGLDRMVDGYENLYTTLLAQRRVLPGEDGWRASGALRRSG